MGEVKASEEVDRIMNMVDTDGNNCIDYSEFVTACVDRKKFLSMKIQTDELEKIEATSADNINMSVTSTVNWRIVDPEVAAVMAAETMAVTANVVEATAGPQKGFCFVW